LLEQPLAYTTWQLVIIDSGLVWGVPRTHP